ncbi:UNVERIFIED_ORG: putative membrane protein [Gordonia westfalica J30]
MLRELREQSKCVLLGRRIPPDSDIGPPIRHARTGRLLRMLAFLVRTVCTAVALWVATLIVPGIEFVGGSTTAEKVGIALVVAIIFGLLNAFVKPIVQIISIPFYILTLGLIHIVINALMLEITAWITRNTTHWGLEVDDFFWSAIFGAIVVSVVGWLLALLMRDSVDR